MNTSFISQGATRLACFDSFVDLILDESDREALERLLVVIRDSGALEPGRDDFLIIPPTAENVYDVWMTLSRQRTRLDQYKASRLYFRAAQALTRKIAAEKGR